LSLAKLVHFFYLTACHALSFVAAFDPWYTHTHSVWRQLSAFSNFLPIKHMKFNHNWQKPTNHTHRHTYHTFPHSVWVICTLITCGLNILNMMCKCFQFSSWDLLHLLHKCACVTLYSRVCYKGCFIGVFLGLKFAEISLRTPLCFLMHKMFLFQVNTLNQLLMPKDTLEEI